MPCEKFKDAIVEAATAQLQPEGELRSHLDACDECCAAFALEQSLYVSIDFGVRAAANSEVPPSLLPNIRVRLQEENAPKRTWISAWPSLAGTTLAVFAVLLIAAIWQLKTPHHAGGPTSGAETSSAAVPVRNKPSSAKAPALPTADVMPNTPHRALSFARQKNPVSSTPGIEVLVQRDQEILLTNYAKQLRRKNLVLREPEKINAPEPAPLQVDLIQIAQLDVKPLADETSK